MTENESNFDQESLDLDSLDLGRPEAEPTGEPTASAGEEDTGPVGPSRALAEAVQQQALEILELTRKRVSAKDAFAADSVHEIRVASKKLRALWQLMRPVIEPQIAQDADARLGSLAAVLSRSRDTQVLTELLADLRDSDEPLYRGAFDRAATLLDNPEAVELDHESTRSALLGGLDGDREEWRLLVLPDDNALIDHGLGRTYRKAWRRAETAARTGDGNDNHSWRKWAKYLRYQLERLGEPGADLGRRIASLKTLGGALGKRNDLYNLRNQLEQRHEGDPFGAVFRAIDLRDQALARRIEGVAKTLFASTPDESTTILRRELAAGA
jgi:CHAD domain-containing protein